MLWHLMGYMQYILLGVSLDSTSLITYTYVEYYSDLAVVVLLPDELYFFNSRRSLYRLGINTHTKI